MKILLSLSILAVTLYDCSESAKTKIANPEKFVDCDYDGDLKSTSSTAPKEPCDESEEAEIQNLRDALAGKVWSGG